MKLTESLGQFEQLIMTALMTLGNDAYGMQIYSKVCELADREMNLGSMYVTLERLEKKGYVSSKVAEGGPAPFGKRQLLFRTPWRLETCPTFLQKVQLMRIR